LDGSAGREFQSVPDAVQRKLHRSRAAQGLQTPPVCGKDTCWADNPRPQDAVAENGSMSNMLNQQVLRTDVSGMPLEWIGYQEAVRLIVLEQVSYALGSVVYTLHGGINALTGHRTAR